ncbi:hypothetical protein [Candidatus Epulonipiscium viviparus]|uniref:hypothetical protein n=1 Tax=Candidatus Epulonipiscium viviparus TaxID=420336 RepID=UPI00016C04B1|nr:hypothetical protein [Candidatus Epulopiscium viviparus]
MRIRLMISILYLILGIMSVYTNVIIFFIPLLTLPLIRFHVGTKLSREYILLDIVIAFIMYFASNSVLNCVIYITLIILPAYSIIKEQEKESINYPKLIFLTGTIIWGGLLVQGELMKYYGYSYYEAYRSLISNMFVAMNSEIYALGLEELMLSMYPSTLFVSAILLAFITVSVNQKRVSQDSMINQLFSFRLSKMIFLIILLAIIMVFNTDIMYLSEIGMNLIFILFILFYVAGMWGMMSYVIMAKTTPVAKFLGIIMMLIVLPIAPIFPLLYGFFDAIFNFRRIELVV